MTPDLGNRFLKFNLAEHETKVARAVSPYFMAYLQNKIADYAFAVVEYTYEDDTTRSLIEHEKLKAQVIVLEELMRELTPPETQPDDERQS